jgi:uncharacterized sulfatase
VNAEAKTEAVVLRAIQTLAVILALVAMSHEPCRGEDKRPNVVLIISDDHSYPEYGWMGHPHIKTPLIDKLATEGLTFQRGYVTNSVCGPSLTTMLTGLYVHQHRRTTNHGGVDKTMLGLFMKCPRMPAILGEAGYVSYQGGKFWQGRSTNAGFAEGENGARKVGRETMQPIYDFIDRAEEQQKPFFVWYAPYIPHSPHTPPQKHLDAYSHITDAEPRHLAKYAMISWLDETCGQLLDHLQRQGLRENTLIMYIVDNGVGVRGGRGGKSKAYEGGVRTPVIIHWPDHVRPKMDNTTPVSAVDVAPTILSACGIEPPAEMAGINLLDADAVARREAVFSAEFGGLKRDPHDPTMNCLSRTCFRNEWKLILRRDGSAELYDVVADGLEEDDLAAIRPDLVAQMTKLINQWWNVGKNTP